MVRTYSNNPSITSTAFSPPPASKPPPGPREETLRLLNKLQKDYNQLLESVNLGQIRRERVNSSQPVHQPLRPLSRHSSQRSSSVPSRNSRTYPTPDQPHFLAQLDIVDHLHIEQQTSLDDEDEKQYLSMSRQKIMIPREAEKMVEPVYGGLNPADEVERRIRQEEKARKDAYRQELESQMKLQQQKRQNSSYQRTGNAAGADIAQREREAAKSQSQQYQRELQRQMEEQREQRMRNEMDFGSTAREQLLQERRSTRPLQYADDPPWLKGNPQPKNGVRNSKGWQGEPVPLQRQKSLPPNFQTGYGLPGTMPLTSSFIASPLDTPFDPYNSALNHQQLLNQRNDQQKQLYNQQLESERVRREQQRRGAQTEEYNPFGKGGGGAPIRDRNGNVVADRRNLQKSWNGLQDTNLPHESGLGASGSVRADGLRPSASLGALDQSVFGAPMFGTPVTTTVPPFLQNSGKPLSEKDKNKLELLQQIEEKKRQREREKELERLQDAEDQRRITEYQEKQRREAEAEQKRQEEKLAAKLEKSNALAEKQSGPAPTEGGKARQRRKSHPAVDDGLEWWERGPPRSNRPPSAALPAHQKRNQPPPSRGRTPLSTKPPPPEATYESVEILQKEDSSSNRRKAPAADSEDEENKSKGTYRPSTAAKRNEGVMRQLSAMRERLTKEQSRVKSALRRKDYNDQLFSDEEELQREDSPPSLLHRRQRKISLDDLDEPPSLLHRKKRLDSDDEEIPNFRTKSRNEQDPPLVSLIKNSRTLLNSANSTRPSPRSSRKKKTMKGFLSDSDDEDLPRLGRRKSSVVGGDENPDKVVNSFLKKRGVPVSAVSRR